MCCFITWRTSSCLLSPNKSALQLCWWTNLLNVMSLKHPAILRTLWRPSLLFPNFSLFPVFFCFDTTSCLTLSYSMSYLDVAPLLDVTTVRSVRTDFWNNFGDCQRSEGHWNSFLRLPMCSRGKEITDESYVRIWRR